MSAYKRVSDWNGEIIQPINELAADPPEGCDPVDPLDEAEEDHLWKKQDVIDVQEKLKEICPDNEFEELETPQLATREIIDEILAAIAGGWCGCKEEPDSWSLGIFTCQKRSGTSIETECCNIEVENKGPFWWMYGYSITTYTSPYLDTGQYSDENYQNILIAKEKYDTAKMETYYWIIDREEELQQQHIVKQKSEELKSKEATLEALQLALSACTTGCGGIQSQITEIEQEISDLEDEIDEAKEKRDEAREKAEEHLSKADAAAEENWTAWGNMKSWDPSAVNMVDLLGDFSKEWGLGKYPFNYNRSRWSITRDIVYPEWENIYDVSTRVGYFTPSGKPYMEDSSLIWGSSWYAYSNKLRICVPYQMALGTCDGDTYQSEYYHTHTLPSFYVENSTLELKVIVTQGTKKAEEYEP